jgi:hypothetical protein
VTEEKAEESLPALDQEELKSAPQGSLEEFTPKEESVWTKAQGLIRAKISQTQFDIWFKSMICQVVGIGLVELRSANPEMSLYIQRNFGALISGIFASLGVTEIRYGVFNQDELAKYQHEIEMEKRLEEESKELEKAERIRKETEKAETAAKKIQTETESVRLKYQKMTPVELFTILFTAWPVQQGFSEARDIFLMKFDKLPPLDELLELINKFKNYDRSWTRGYVPNLSKWLKEERWTDKPYFQAKAA